MAKPLLELPSDALAPGGERPFRFRGEAGVPTDGFIVRVEGLTRAYVNVCPHWSIRLDTEEGRFLDEGGRTLVCGNHEARFRVIDGFCEAGPCAGASLTPLRVEEVGGRLRVYRGSAAKP